MKKKFIVFGNSGSGKSTLARRLCIRHNLFHLDLDTLAWEQDATPTRRHLSESKNDIDNFINENEGWVIEGCYIDLIEVAKSHANVAIYINPPIESCIQNAQRRPWESHKYESKEAQDRNLEMLINWIKDYAERSDTASEEAHEKFFNEFLGEKRMIYSNEEGVDL